VGVVRDSPKFLGTPIVSGTGKDTDLKLCKHIHRTVYKFAVMYVVISIV